MLYLGLCSYIVAYAMDFKTIIVRLDDQVNFFFDIFRFYSANEICFHCQVTLNQYTAKKKKKRSIDIQLMLSGILAESFEAHLDLYRYDTDLNLFAFENVGMNSLCCQQITGKHTEIGVWLFIFSIFIHVKLHCLRCVWTGRCHTGTKL